MKAGELSYTIASVLQISGNEICCRHIDVHGTFGVSVIAASHLVSDRIFILLNIVGVDMEKIVLIDGHSILNRAFYGVPNLTNSEGIHTNAVYGFLNILFKLLEEEKPQYLAVAFDLKAPTFRHTMYEEYKGTRKPMPQELHEQVPLTKEVLGAMGIPILTKEGYEADDVLGTAAKHAQENGYEVTIVSGDRDLLQLADEHIKISIPKTSRGTTEVHNYYPEDVVREYQVTPQQFIDVKALMGDTSDNIPGVPSVGEKTATNLILQFGSVEGVYEHLDEVKPPRAKKSLEENRELADISYKLAKICIEAPINFEPANAKIGNLYTEEAYEFMSRMEFKSMLTKFGAHVKGKESKKHTFVPVTDLIEAGELFAKAKKSDHVGAQLLIDHGKVSGLAICFAEDVSYVLPATGFLTGDYLAEQLRDLCKAGNVWVLDLKSQLPFLDLGYDTCVYDAGVAAYLLNPLKDSYGYDDLARDYLGLTLPGRAELLKKMTFASAWESAEEEYKTCAGYMGYVAYMVGKPLMERLEAEEMKELYLTMELPLIYALYHMEEEGIAVRKEELKAYGEKLKEKSGR